MIAKVNRVTSHLSSGSLILAGGFIVLIGLWYLLLTGNLNLLLAVILVSGILLLSMKNKVAAILVTLFYLNIMGDLRRIANLIAGNPSLDFLLLVGPIVAFLLAAPLLLRLKLTDSISKAMLALTVLMTLEIFNPQQGGIAIGFSGALYYIAPMLWFWIGRGFMSPEATRKLLYSVIFPLAVVASLFGLYQTFIGFFPYEQAWIDSAVANYSALSLGSTIRPFGFSISAAEYATLLALVAAGAIAAWIASRSAWLLALPLLITSIFLASGRTVIVKLFLAAVTVWILRKGKKPTASSLLMLGSLIIVGLASISYVAGQFASDATSVGKQSAAQNALSHVSGGLAHPFDERYSTAGIHQGMFLRGIAAGFTSPLGHGLGTTTGAAAKFGGPSENFSSEIDLSDMFVSLGAVGGLMYIYIFISVLYGTIQYIRVVPKNVSLPVVAILISTVGAWLISGQYSTSALVFVLIGAIVKAKNTNKDAEAMRLSNSVPLYSFRPGSRQPVLQGKRRSAASLVTVSRKDKFRAPSSSRSSF